MLSGRCCEHDTISGALDSLITAGLVLAAPLYRAVRAEIDDRNLLNAMSKRPLGDDRVVVRNPVSCIRCRPIRIHCAKYGVFWPKQGVAQIHCQ